MNEILKNFPCQLCCISLCNSLTFFLRSLWWKTWKHDLSAGPLYKIETIGMLRYRFPGLYDVCCNISLGQHTVLYSVVVSVTLT